jgi:hypothetical protein
MSKHKTSIIVYSNTRDILRTLGRKDQTYNDIINELIMDKKKDAFGSDQSKAS